MGAGGRCSGGGARPWREGEAGSAEGGVSMYIICDTGVVADLNLSSLVVNFIFITSFLGFGWLLFALLLFLTNGDIL